MSAGALLQSQLIDPANVVQGGVGSNSRLVLILKDDLAGYTASGIDVITALTLAANARAFVFEGIRQSQTPSAENVKVDSGQFAFKHAIGFRIFAYDQISKNNWGRLSAGRYVAISENAKLDANTIEIYGIDVGLELVKGKRGAQEMGGAIDISLESPDKEYEAKPPHSFGRGYRVYATNRAAIDALCFLPTIGVGGLSIVTYPAVTPTAIVITGTNFFANSANTAVLRVDLINQATGSIIPFTAALVTTGTTITTSTPATGEGAGKLYKVRVTTTAGVVLSAQNILTT